MWFQLSITDDAEKLCLHLEEEQKVKVLLQAMQDKVRRTSCTNALK